MEAPVAFMFFNRHDTTLRVFERIRQVRPKKLILISDGARPHVEGETLRVLELRKKVEALIDWDVDVEKDYAQSNMGCGPRLATGITSVLGKYEKAIFIEDDCLPTLSFFDYAENMLQKYEKDNEILSVSGTYFLKKKKMPYDYGFTHFPQIWGWATWARAWEGYDRDLKGWDDGFIYDIAKSGNIKSFQLDTWLRCFKNIQADTLHTWDIQYWFLCLKKRGLSIFPYQNQITNIGYCPDATHTSCWWFSDKPQYEFNSPIRSPNSYLIDSYYEKWLQQEFYGDKITHRNFLNCSLLSAKLRLKRFKTRFLINK